MAFKKGRECEVINRERKSWKGVNEEIELREWTDYFKGLSGGVEKRIRGEGRRKEIGKEDRKISKKKFMRHCKELRKMRLREVMGWKGNV